MLDLTARVEAALAALPLPVTPRSLYDPARFALSAGGKRVRPLVVLLAAEAYGGEVAVDRALPAALAAEVFHTFTLVHDDIMDHASTRRGRPTVHVQWDEATAILAGDLLMGLAYDLLAQTDGVALGPFVRRFHVMVTRLCEGQALDKAFETRRDVAVPDYLDMIERKTAALLEWAFEAGATVGGAPVADVRRLGAAGRALGRAFQIQDDVLDLTAEDDAWGKAVGGDLVEGKRTFLVLRALERASGDERGWLLRIFDGLPPEDVPEARARLERLGVLDEARATARDDLGRGLHGLEVLPAGPPADALRHLADAFVTRVR